jgi:mannose-6-phosphate isomerase-like protein (cupin superfamily)
MAGDAIQVAPDKYKVIEENDRVRILEYRGGAGAKTEMHSHSDVVAIAVADIKVKFTSPDGQSFEAELKSGQAMFMPAHEHSTENVGGTEAHVILVELK